VYGPNQYWEKIIPKFTYLLQKGEKVPVYGKGDAMRKYLFVGDACEAYKLIMEKGKVGEVYQMGSDNEVSALEMAKNLIETLKPNQNFYDYISFVEDRKFHDSRYIVDQTSLKKLGWFPKTPFVQGLQKTIEWYTNYAIPFSHWDYDDKQTLIPKNTKLKSFL